MTQLTDMSYLALQVMHPPTSTINVAIVIVKCLLRIQDMAHSCGLITSCDSLLQIQWNVSFVPQ